jgi:exopolysaccharide biosynthesis polyprenyl glycosylphosphotransferase
MFKSEPISFYLTVIWFILATVFLVTGRFTLRGVYGMLWKLGLCRKRVLLVGSASGTLEYLRLLRTQRHSGYEHAGVLLDSRSLQSHSEELLGLPVLGSISDCESRLKELKPELLIVTWAPGDEQWLHNLIQGCKRLPVDVELYSHVLATANLAHEPDEFSGCFRFYARSEWPMLVQRVLKRGMDIVIGFVGSVVTVILVPMIYVVANLEKRGPLFYRSAYLGQDGSIHYYLKFRTMEIDADRILQADPVLRARFQEHQKLVDDPRVTKVGRILRKFSLDEFPQFFSVLKGDLAFVGPRTIRKEEAGRYGARLTRLMSVKPGVTGLWQVMGRQTTTYEERVEMDMFYVDRWSIWLDLVIMAKTFWKVLKTEGAY